MSLEVFSRVQHFIFDIDGVFTDSSLLITEAGEFLRTMSTRDGFAVKLASRLGCDVAVITGGSSLGVNKRLSMLGIDPIFSGVKDKETVLKQLIEDRQLNPDHILYMGDDLPDWEVMQMVGIPVCPADAVPEIQQLSVYVSPFPGGGGCVRDVIEKTLRVQGKWPYP